MNNKQQILRLLRDADRHMSGQYLCERLGISRTAVWKIIRKLKQEGYPIEAVTNKGYRLLSVEGRDLFNKDELENVLDTGWAGHPLIYKAGTGSTNADIFSLSDEGYPEGTLVVTSRQTAGKGRRGRAWISPADVNIYMSILLKPEIRADKAPMLTLVMALAVWQACEELYGQEDIRFGIKWPNDIVVTGRGADPGYRDRNRAEREPDGFSGGDPGDGGIDQESTGLSCEQGGADSPDLAVF